MKPLSIKDSKYAEWLSRLVQIPSVTPSQAPSQPEITREERISGFLADWFQRLGGEVITQEVSPGRPNVYGIWKGQTNRWAAVDVHLDTVGVTQMTDDPFSGRINDGKVFGRGAADTKATMAILLAILEAMQEAGRKPVPNLLLVGTVDEEIGGIGAEAFAKWLKSQDFRINQLLVAEPTLCQPIIGHKGEVRLAFTVQGKSAHSSQPEQGKNAILAAAGLLHAFEDEHRRLQEIAPHPDLGHAKLTVTMIEGGSGLNVVPDSCKISIDRRTLAGENAECISRELSELATKSCSLPIEIEPLSTMSAFYQSADTPWVQELSKLSGTTPGVVPFGTNAFAYAGLADEIVVMGPGSIDQAHGAEEWIAISELVKMGNIIQQWWSL